MGNIIFTATPVWRFSRLFVPFITISFSLRKFYVGVSLDKTCPAITVCRSELMILGLIRATETLRDQTVFPWLCMDVMG